MMIVEYYSQGGRPWQAMTDGCGYYHREVHADEWATRKAIAAHELGHAFAAVAVGTRVRLMELPLNPGPRITGAVHYSSGTALPEDRLLILAAGPAAAVQVGGQTRDQAWNVGYQTDASDAGQFRKLLQELPAGQRAANESKALRDADALVSDYRERIHTLADKLAYRSEIDGPALEAMIGQVRRTSHYAPRSDRASTGASASATTDRSWLLDDSEPVLTDAKQLRLNADLARIRRSWTFC